MQNLFENLKDLLSNDERFIVDGVLLKNKIIESALQLDKGLLKILLSSSNFKKHFFEEVNGVIIFDKIKFQKFISNKAFLPDSYTSFKNKIGLTVDDQFISEGKEVVLSWPYKDCILEGGQTIEDAKRNEIFWNEILAPDQIDLLLSPKALTNFRRVQIGEESEPTSISKDDNLLIKGNNLLSLYSLLKVYRSKVNIIYIDPPYNTDSVANTFSYNNSFNHSSWLTFMKNRLEVALELMAEDGIICIAIDDEEYAHLKLLCDAIFKRENYLGTIIVQSNPRGRTINSFFATCHEYALFYSKNKSLATVYDLALNSDQELDFGEEDSDGKFRYLPFRRSGGTSTPDERPNSEFSLVYSKSRNQIIAVGGERIEGCDLPYTTSQVISLGSSGDLLYHNYTEFLSDYMDDVIEILPIDTSGKRRVWRWSDRKAILQAAKKGDFRIIIDGDKYTVQLKDRRKAGRKAKTIWTDSKYDASANGTMLLKKIFDGEKPFSYPKSLYTVKDILQILSQPESEDIILDFFGGSGTTAHAVLELNAEDGGFRKFIICEQMDYAETVTKERIKRVIDKNKEGSFIYCELAQANQFFVNKIDHAKNFNELKEVEAAILSKAFLSYRFNENNLRGQYKEYESLKFEEQKQLLLDILDKNLLHLPLSEIRDQTFLVSENEIKLNEKFYNQSQVNWK